jgi:hypothetical protein
VSKVLERFTGLVSGRLHHIVWVCAMCVGMNLYFAINRIVTLPVAVVTPATTTTTKKHHL